MWHNKFRTIDNNGTLNTLFLKHSEGNCFSTQNTPNANSLQFHLLITDKLHVGFYRYHY